MSSRKIFLLGMGVGLILAAFLVLLAGPHQDLTRSEIEWRARQLGMVYPAEELGWAGAGQGKGALSVHGDGEGERSAGTGADNGKRVTVVVPKDLTASEIAQALVEGGVIKEKQPFIEEAVKRGIDTRFRAGVYLFRGDETLDEVFRVLTGTLR